MLSLGGGGNEIDEELRRRRGGLVYDDNDESDEDDKPEPMDESGDDGAAAAAAAEEVSMERLCFPEPNPEALRYTATAEGQSFSFDPARIPATVATVHPRILAAMDGREPVFREVTEKIKAGVAFHPCMPMVVHSSPLVALFMAATPKGSASAKALAFAPRYMSFTKSCCQLQQLKMACIGGLFPFHPTFTAEHLQRAKNEYSHQIKAMEELQNIALDELYAIASNGGGVTEATMLQFIALLEDYSLQYIHLLEYFLFTCLVEPHGAATAAKLSLQHVLTPNERPSLSAAAPSPTGPLAQEVLEDVAMFFQHKAEMRAKQEADNANAQHANVDVTTTTGRQWAAYLIPNGGTPFGTDLLYNGYVPKQTLRAYFHYLDCDGVIK